MNYRDSLCPANDRGHDPVLEKVAVAAKEKEENNQVMLAGPAAVLLRMTVEVNKPAGTTKPAPTGRVFLFVVGFLRIYKLLIWPSGILS